MNLKLAHLKKVNKVEASQNQKLELCLQLKLDVINREELTPKLFKITIVNH